MAYTRREFGKLALAGLPAAAVLGNNESIFAALAQAKPNSLINGVQIGTITYSYRSMRIRAPKRRSSTSSTRASARIELMGGPVESFAGRAAAGAGGGAAGGGAVRRTGRWPAAAAAGAARGSDGPGRRLPMAVERPALSCRRGGGRAAGPAAGGGGPGAHQAAERAAARSQRAPAQQEQATKLKEWRTSVSMEQVQEAPQDVQRRRRDDLRLEAAQPEHVGRGVRVHLQRGRSAGVHAHDAGAAGRRTRS